MAGDMTVGHGSGRALSEAERDQLLRRHIGGPIVDAIKADKKATRLATLQEVRQQLIDRRHRAGEAAEKAVNETGEERWKAYLIALDETIEDIDAMIKETTDE